MARTVLHTVYPYEAGTDRSISDWHYVTIEHDTSKAYRREPFCVVWHACGMVMEKTFTHVTDACAALPAEVASMTKNHSGRDYTGKLQRCSGGWPCEYAERNLRKRGTINRMRADMGWNLERALLEYDTDPAQRV